MIAYTKKVVGTWFFAYKLDSSCKNSKKNIFWKNAFFDTYFLDFHFLRGLFIGICAPFKLEPSNLGSAHLLWIYYKWYLNFFLLLSYGPFSNFAHYNHSKFSLSDLNTDHIVQARTFRFWLKIALLNVLKVLFQFLILYLWLLNNFLKAVISHASSWSLVWILLTLDIYKENDFRFC